MTDNNFDWDELKRKIKEEDQKDNDPSNSLWTPYEYVDIRETEEDSDCDACDNNCSECHTSESLDYNDEHGIVDQNIQDIAWNKIDDIIEIKCGHFDSDSITSGEVYVYPINDNQRVCLCKICNANLASKMFEQLALETFMIK